MTGSGTEDTDFVGAAIANTARLNGHFNFHYDEALAKFGPARGFIITDWEEMTPGEVACTSITLDF